MYKNRHSWGDKNTRGLGVMDFFWGVPYTSMHFVQIDIIVRTGNLWLSNGSCHIIPSDAIKALFAWTVLERFRTIPRQDAALSEENLMPRHRWRALMRPFTERRTSPTQCATVRVSERSVPWQCGQSGPFKSPWAAGRSPKSDSIGQNEIKKKQKRSL